MPLAAALALVPVLWIADESEKVRPDAQPPPPPRTLRIRLASAGGDCAAAQIAIRGPALTFAAAAAPLTDAARRTIPVGLSRVATLQLEQPSGPEGEAGEWPDALIPQRDALYGEARLAFPIDVPAGRTQAVFVEACVPRGNGPGRFSGEVRLSWAGGAARVPIELRARGFDLPATPALVTAFGFSGAAKGHGRPPEADRELATAYATLALRRGITLYGATQDLPAFAVLGDDVRIGWDSYDAQVGPFLEGTVLLSGARWTSVELRMPGNLTRPQRRSWRRAWVDHFRSRGWLDRLYVYVHDEPDDRMLPAVEAKAREVREDAPEVRRLVTTSWSAELPSVDLWVPVINCLADADPSCPRAVPRARYQRLWWYQSCMSHGCSGDAKPVLDPAFRGWPSYMIDAPATAARAMGTLAFTNDVEGELYYDVVFADSVGDPWRSQWAFGGNGDGTLYYPGTPQRIGGRHDVPIESLRLVQIARGIADHEYLALCARLGDPSFARAEARALAPGTKTWSRDPKAYTALRDRVGARIEGLLVTPKTRAQR